MESKDFILASASPQRLALLSQLNMKPKLVCPADINETEYAHETPSHYVKRMASEKALKVASLYPNENILACDTIVVVGRRILHKANNDQEQIQVMHLLSGRSSRVLSAVCFINKCGKISLKISDSRVITRKLSEKEIRDYVETHEWYGCSGYKIEGLFSGFVRKIVGSYSGIVGLPLYETQNLLNGAGIR